MIYGSFDNWSKDLYKQHFFLLNGGFQNPEIKTKTKKVFIKRFC